MHVAQEPGGERPAAREAFHASVEGGDAAAHFACIVERDTWLLVGFVEEQVGEGRLRALDLRGENGLLAHEAVEEERDVWEMRRDGVESAECDEGVVESA